MCRMGGAVFLHVRRRDTTSLKRNASRTNERGLGRLPGRAGKVPLGLLHRGTRAFHLLRS